LTSFTGLSLNLLGLNISAKPQFKIKSLIPNSPAIAEAVIKVLKKGDDAKIISLSSFPA
jgi:hypothetical protein